MAVVPTASQQKWAAVKRVLSGENVAAISRENGVSRLTIYHWLKVAEEGALAAFARDTPGKRMISPEQEAELLRDQLRNVLIEYHKITGSRAPVAFPPACPQCQSVQVCRNGTVSSKAHGLRQRFWCRRCFVSIYIDVKKTLLSSKPVTKKSRAKS